MIVRYAILLAGVALLCVMVGRGILRWAEQRGNYAFDPERVSLIDRPPHWLEPAMARGFFGSWLETAGEPFSLLDEPALASFAKRLSGLAWVRELKFERRLPNRLALDVRLHRPVAATLDPSGLPWLVAANGALLPVDLPRFPRTDVGTSMRAAPFGLCWVEGARQSRAFADAAEIAGLYRGAFSRLVADQLRETGERAPRLIAVDATNFGYARDRSRAEYSVVVSNHRAQRVRLQWGHAKSSRFEVIPWRDKAVVLARLMREWPGLGGIAGADLRFVTRYRERVVPAVAKRGAGREPLARGIVAR